MGSGAPTSRGGGGGVEVRSRRSSGRAGKRGREGGRAWGSSLGEQLLEEALLLGLVVLGALRSGALLGGRSSDGALVQVGVTANQVHCALDVREHLNLLHLHTRKRRCIPDLEMLNVGDCSDTRGLTNISDPWL